MALAILYTLEIAVQSINTVQSINLLKYNFLLAQKASYKLAPFQATSYASLNFRQVKKNLCFYLSTSLLFFLTLLLKP